ncbi:MAG: ComF family protein [Lysobacter sp.]|nr:ComF family protein [Lysobacter sp.]
MSVIEVDARPTTVAGALGRWLWPARCLLCDAPAAGRRDVCGACASALPWNRIACLRCALPLTAPASACGQCLRKPPPLTETHATFVYGFPLDRLLPRFKFHDGLVAGRLLSQWMHDACVSLDHPNALIPIPLHRARLRQRGYDQALELARPLATSLEIELCDDLLLRTRHTQPQSRLGALQRRRNLRGAFVVREGIALPRHVVLVDDVMTTGATLHAAAKTLLRAGVERVDAWVCARVP